MAKSFRIDERKYLASAPEIEPSPLKSNSANADLALSSWEPPHKIDKLLASSVKSACFVSST